MHKLNCDVDGCSRHSIRQTDGYIVGPQTSYEHPVPNGRNDPTRADSLPQEVDHPKKRQRPTSEKPILECTFCGKLFIRSCNWKSHMDMHNPLSGYPCTAMVGNVQCPKRYQRKVDLDKHVDSVC